MKMLHAALVCSSLAKADAFFEGILGLKKAEPKVLPRPLSEAIFSLSSEMTVVNYADDDALFEVFIYPQARKSGRPIEHVCIEAADPEGIIRKCRSLNLQVIQAPKGDSLVTFVSDFDNNLFELKEKKKTHS